MMTARLSHADKIALAQTIVAKAKLLIAASGKPVPVSRHQVTPAIIGDLKVMMATPFSGVKTEHGDFRYEVDIWVDGLGKVFGAGWEPQQRWANKFECSRLVKGEWIAGFLAR